MRYIGSGAVQFWCQLDAVFQSHISNTDFQYMADALAQLYLNAFCLQSI